MDFNSITSQAISVFSGIGTNYIEYIAFGISIILIIFIERPLVGIIVRFANQRKTFFRFLLFIIACVGLVPLVAYVLKETVLSLLTKETGRLIVFLVSFAVVYGIFTIHYKNI